MKVYKLTDQNLQTFNNFQWQLNVPAPMLPPDNASLCSEFWYYAYEHPLLAILHNPIHADFKNPRLFEAEAFGDIKRDGFLKLGCKQLTLIKELDPPEISLTNRIAYAILCAKKVYFRKIWNIWADQWLKNENRHDKFVYINKTVWYNVAADDAAAYAATYAATYAAYATTQLDLISIALKAMKIN